MDHSLAPTGDVVASTQAERLKARKAGSMRRRTAVTLAVLAAYHLAGFIALPGIDVSQLQQPGYDLSGSLPRFSIMALGLIPWFSALAMAELAVLLLPQAWTRRIHAGGHANPFAFPVIAFALTFAAFQGYGVSVALQIIPFAIDFDGGTFVLVATATLMCGTALAIALANIIQTNGIGAGFWVLVAALSVLDIIPNVQWVIAEVQQGSTSAGQVIGITIATLLAVASLSLLLGARFRLGLTRIEPVIWPIQLAGLALPWIAVIAGLAAGGGAPMVHAALFPDQPAGLLFMVTFVVVFVLLYCRRENSPAFLLPTAIILALILVGFMGGWPFIPRFILTAGNLVIVTAVAFSVLAQWRAGAR